MGRKKNKKKTSKIVRALLRLGRSLVAVVILAALVLGVSFGVGKLSKLNPVRLYKVVSSALASFGFDENITKKIEKGFSEPAVYVAEEAEDQEVSQAEELGRTDEVITRISIIADSHIDWEDDEAAVKEAVKLQSDILFHVGDHSNLGLVRDLEKSKKLLADSGLTYYAIPGDRDLWQSVGPDNFLQVFKKNYYFVEVGDVKILALDNSANYTTVDADLMKSFDEDVKKATFVLLSQPLWHPKNETIMGVVNGEVVTEVRQQAEEILDKIRQSDVKAIFAGDQHAFSKNSDSEKEDLVHYALGAVTNDKNLQSPRFVILDLFEDGSYKVQQVVLSKIQQESETSEAEEGSPEDSAENSK